MWLLFLSLYPVTDSSQDETHQDAEIPVSMACVLWIVVYDMYCCTRIVTCAVHILFCWLQCSTVLCWHGNTTRHEREEHDSRVDV